MYRVLPCIFEWSLYGFSYLRYIEICILSSILHFIGFNQGNRHLSASQLHLLLHPTEEQDDDVLRASDQIVSSFIHPYLGLRGFAVPKGFVNIEFCVNRGYRYVEHKNCLKAVSMKKPPKRRLGSRKNRVTSRSAYTEVRVCIINFSYWSQYSIRAMGTYLKFIYNNLTKKPHLIWIGFDVTK